MANKFYIKWTPEKLIKRVDAKRVKVLYKQGAYLKTAMARSMKYVTGFDLIGRKVASKPGEPPRAHKDNPKGPLLRKLIQFAVDKITMSVVTGPVLTSSSTESLPHTLDKGGTIRSKRQLKQTEYKIGDFAPIRGARKFVRIRMETAAQCERATRLVAAENVFRNKSAATVIKPRPFTTPLLSDGGENFRKLVHSVPL